MTAAVFAVPGDLRTRTGGYIYERRLLEALRAQGRVVHHLPLPAGFPDPTAAEMAEALRLLGEVPADAPLILDGFLTGALDPAGVAALRAPILAIVHHPLGLESGLTPDRAAFLRERERANLALARRVLVPSPHTAAVLAADFGVPVERIAVAPPGFDPARGPRQPVTPPLVLAVGILHPRKGHDVLLDALARIADLSWQAVIAGGTHDAAHAASLHARAARDDLGGRVRFTGEVGEAEIGMLYRQATVFALATRYEGYGMVFGEAMRHCLPVVSCRTGAVPDTVPAAAGVLVPPGDPVAFADALRVLLTDAGERGRLAAGAAQAGEALPGWSDTAAIAGVLLDAIAAEAREGTP